MGGVEWQKERVRTTIESRDVGGENDMSLSEGGW